jgi:glycogen debranching enzyme
MGLTFVGRACRNLDWPARAPATQEACFMNVRATQVVDPASQAPEPFSVSATISLQERRYRTLKNGDTFGVFDHSGDILSVFGGADGLYHMDTRHLSRFDLILGGMRPLLLSSTLAADNVLVTSDLSNTANAGTGAAALDQGVIHVQRSLFLGVGACHGRLTIRNFANTRSRVRLELRFEADFADLFEVRGMRRERRGERLPVALAGDNVTLSYCGLDGFVRATRLAFQPAPQTLTAGSAMFDLELESHDQATIFLEVACAPGMASGHSPRAAFLAAYVHAKRRLRNHASRAAVISSPHEDFDETLRRSANDLRMLVTEKPTGPYPYAGIPWFSTAFGRDALITALLMLALDPTLAWGVLRYLAQEQATEFDPASEAEPGKILHEMRGGEMAALREVPFRRYYGSVDSTPLFVMLAGAYLDRTGDLATLQALWHSAGWTSGLMPMALSAISEARRMAWPIRAGRTVTTPSLMPTERWHVGRSRCARCRDMCLRHAWPGHRSPGGSG